MFSSMIGWLLGCRQEGVEKSSQQRDLRRLRIEGLEQRNLFAVTGFEPTDHEQYLLELINRARQDPLGEVRRLGGISDLNEGRSPQDTRPAITSESKPPLAFNLNLMEAARGHSNWLIASGINQLDHCGPNRTTVDGRCVQGIGERMDLAGYTNRSSWAENLNFSPVIGAATESDVTEISHDSLFRSYGHRRNMLNPSYREAGLGNIMGAFVNPRSLVVTEKFGSRQSTGAFLTGVVFNDSVTSNGFYSVGEGLGNVTIKAKRQSDQSVVSTTTFSSGGYQIELQPGDYEVQFSIPGLASSVTQIVTMGAENVKVDLNSSQIRSLSLTLSQFEIRENEGSVLATVTRQTTDMSTPLTLNVVSSLRSAATVPQTVIIAANQSSATFTIDAVNDSIVDLTQSTLISVNAVNFQTVSAMVHVIDDDGPSIWHNLRNAFDVNDDGVVAPQDVLIVINRLSKDGTGLAPNTQLAIPVYFDVNGDWIIAPIDVLQVINHLNRRSGLGEGESETAALAQSKKSGEEIELLDWSCFEEAFDFRRNKSLPRSRLFR